MQVDRTRHNIRFGQWSQLMSICSLSFVTHEYWIQESQQNSNTIWWNVTFIAMKTFGTRVVLLLLFFLFFWVQLCSLKLFIVKFIHENCNEQHFYVCNRDWRAMNRNQSSKVHIFICRKSFIAHTVGRIRFTAICWKPWFLHIIFIARLCMMRKKDLNFTKNAAEPNVNSLEIDECKNVECWMV